MATPSEMARDAQKHSENLRIEFELLKQDIEKFDLLRIGERLIRIEEKTVQLEKSNEEIKRVPVIDDRVNKLEKHKDDSEKRGWQFVYIFSGAVAALLCSFLVQLIFFLLKK